MSQWQPIETAPADGREILVFNGEVHVANMNTEQDMIGRWGFYTREGDWLGGFCTPTHWMPLPEPPEAA